MTGRLRTSRAGLELIKSFEGFRDVAARLPDGRWTIGYGHVRSAREGLKISERDADELLVIDLMPIEAAINSAVFTPLLQNQFDALASLVFNISPERFRDSDVLRHLNAGDFLSAAKAFDVWRRARIQGRVMVVDALVRRRAAEKAMFLEHPQGRPTAPTPLLAPEPDEPGVIAATEEPVRARATGESDDDRSFAQNSPDIAEAVRRLAERTQAIGARSAEPGRGPGAGEAEAEGERRSPPQSAEEIEDVRREVAQRLARILERAQAGDGGGPASGIETAPANRSTSATRARTLIDDTETYDPGRDPAQIFAEAERNAEIVNGRAHRLGLLNARVVSLAPWIMILVLSLIGLSIGLVDLLRPGEAVAPGASTVLALFGMLMVMSIYFIFFRPSEDQV